MSINYGDTPYIKRGSQIDKKRLFFTDENMALKDFITIPPGYGIIPAGTVMGEITESTNRKGQYVPYAIQAPTLGLGFIGGAYFLTDGTSAMTLLQVTLGDSYKFAVGDHIAGVDSDAVPIDIGAISAIDRTTYSNKATITVTSIDLSSLTVAKGAMIFIQTQTTTPYTNAMAILIEAVDTGIGPDSVGGNGGIVLSNAMLYKGMLTGLDSGAITDLGAITRGQYLVMK